MMKVRIYAAGTVQITPKLKKQLKEITRRFLLIERMTGGEIELVLGGDALLRRLNYNYRGEPRATDVLSFPFLPRLELEKCRNTSKNFVLGEIYISWRKCLEQALERNIAPSQELKRLTVHGLFHLIGQEHGTWEEEMRMRLQERKFLREMQRRLRRRRLL